jgi:bacterioferritin-associated ferredoxin
MYVCICQQVTDREIQQAVSLGATRMRDLTKHLGVASNCGRCAETAKCVLQDALAEERMQASCLQAA